MALTQWSPDDELTSARLNEMVDAFNAIEAIVADGTVSVADGTEALPGLRFTDDTNTGLRRVSADYLALVVGANDAIRISSGLFGPRVGFGNIDEPGATDTDENLLHVHWAGTTANNGIIAGEFQVTDNAATDRAGTGIPDFSGVTAVVIQDAAAAGGAMRALEAHAVRAHASAGASANATALGLELGIHTGATGNASFSATGTAFPKTMGIWVSSYQDSIMTALGVSAVSADCGIYINGAAGYKSGLRYDSTAGVTLFDVSNAGILKTHNAGNQASPQWTFFADQDTGIWWGGANVLAGAANALETFRAYSLSAAHATFKLSVGMNRAGVISPAQLTSNTNNWNPTGIGTASVIRVSTNGALNLTGIVAQEAGTVLTIANVGAANNLVLVHNDTGNSTAANCFFLPASANLTLGPHEAVELWYDTTDSRWRTLSGAQ